MDLASGWVKRSLGRGHEVSTAVLASADFEAGTFRAILPDDVDVNQIQNLEYGGVMKESVARDAFARVLDEFAQRGAACVVVEDDLASRTDPAIVESSEPLAFIGDRVISWCDLDPGTGATAAEIVGRVGSGFPTNAFVVSRSAADLGLADRHSLPEDFGQKAAGCLVAVAVAAFDAESYVIWAEP